MRRALRLSLFVILTGLLVVLAVAVVQAQRELNQADQLAGMAPLEAAGHYEAAARSMIWRADLWEAAGRAAYAGGDDARAVRLLEAGQARRSLSPAGWDELGLAHWALGEHAEALAAWQAAMQADPSFPPVYDHIAMAEHELGDYAAEQAALEQRLALEENAAAEYQLGLLLAASEPERAGQSLTAASRLDPQFEPAVQTMRAALALAGLETDASSRLVTIGRGLGLVGEWRLAQSAFEHAAQADPTNAEAWAWQGEARQHLGQGGKAELDKAVSLDAHSTIVRALRGLYYTRAGDHAAALTEYLQAAQTEPENPAWQASAGESYARTGDLIAALAAYRKATELAPDDPTYWRLLAAFSAHNDVQVQDVGLPAARRAAELAPDDAQTLDVLGLTYSSAGLLYNAEETLKKAIALAPDYAPAHLHLAETYLRKGDRDAAFSELNLVRDLDPNGPTGALALQMLGQYFP